MQHRRVIGTLAGCLGLALVAGAVHIRAQQPADPTRPTSEQVAKVSLAEVGLPEGAASATRFTYEPGRQMTPHTHTGRTSIITVVKGELTETRGNVSKTYKQGDVITVAEGATHANSNLGKETLVYVEVNITGTKPGPAPAAPAAPAR